MTESTFKLGAVIDEDDELVAEVEAWAVSSTVPVISTLWPTCGVSLAASESSRYCVAALPGVREALDVAPAVAEVAPPAGAEVELLAELPPAAITFVNKNAGELAVAVAAPVVPAVPVAAVAVSVAREMHPVSVIFEPELLGVRAVCVAVVGSCGAGRAGEVGAGGFCAMTTDARLKVIAAHVPVHVVLFIVPPTGFLPYGESLESDHSKVCRGQPVGCLERSTERLAYELT